MYERFFKRAIDIAASTATLILLSPLMILVALAIKATDPGPSIFRQQRVGRFGVTFTLFKFRSMPTTTGDVASAELGTINIGPVGRFIRRTNIDELPQLFNIIIGDMSLVGPRPPIPTQTELVALRKANGALRVRPGLTGLAQVNSFDGMRDTEKASFDGHYAECVTFAGDAAILLLTVRYLFSPPPVY